MNVEAVTFRNGNGRNLFGIYHPAGPGRRDLCVILLSPGIKNRVAPHRLYVKIAEQIKDSGVDVFRFDPEGLGDSEGEFEFDQVADLYGAIQSGMFSRDTRDAMDWVEREKGKKRFILGGLCGGAITGLLAGAEDPRVAGLFSIGIPVILDTANPTVPRFMSDRQLGRLENRYIEKIFHPKSWLRLLTFRSDYRLIMKALRRRFGKRTNTDADVAGNPAADQDEQFNPLFPRAFEQFAAGGRPMLLVFSGTDRIYWEFEEKFAKRYGNLLDTYQDRIDLHVIEGANHILSFEEWQRELFRVYETWFNRCYQKEPAS